VYLDGVRHSAVGQAAGDAVIYAALSFDSRQHEDQPALEAVGGVQVI
jgi:hypothetical protein